MIVEDEYEDPSISNEYEYDNYDGEIVSPSFRISVEDSILDPAQSSFANALKRMAQNHDLEKHFQLREDLKHHLFNEHGRYKKMQR